MAAAATDGFGGRLLATTGAPVATRCVVALHLDPLSMLEVEKPSLALRLLDGALPAIAAQTDSHDRDVDLRAYAQTFLEQEVRAEALVRNLGAFSRFLELAAIESGNVVNFSKIAQDVGVAHTTVAGFYEVMHDCLMLERFESLTQSTSRKRLTKASKYVFFDLGVRRACAREGRRPPLEHRGKLFEQYIGLELTRVCRILIPDARVRFWRDPSGPEVDWIVDADGRLLPIEVKWTDLPRPSDARHLATFLREYPTASAGYVVCRTPRPARLGDRITAVPWYTLPAILEDFTRTL